MPNRASAKAADARGRCYRLITASMQEGIERYYHEYPDRVDDARSQEAIAWSLRGIKRVFDILDRFEISDRAGASMPTPPVIPPLPIQPGEDT